MYCKRCGHSIGDNYLFCPVCGQGVHEDCSDSVSNRFNIRNSEAEELNRMIAYFSRKSDQYAEYEKLCLQLNPGKNKPRVGMLVWSIIILSGVAFSLLLSVYRLKFSKDDLVMIIPAVGGVSLLIGFFIREIVRKKRNREICAALGVLSSDLYQHYLNYGPSLISAEFTNPQNLIAIYNILTSGRADTIKESMNILSGEHIKAIKSSMNLRSEVQSICHANGVEIFLFAPENVFI